MNSEADLYKEFVSALIGDYEKSRDLRVVKTKYNNPRSLFDITTENDDLYQSIIRSFHIATEEKVEMLLCKLCERHHVWYQCEQELSSCRTDFIINLMGVNTVVELKSLPSVYNEFSLIQLAEIAEKQPVLIVFLIKDDLEGRVALSKLQGRINKKTNKVKGILFEEFLECYFGKNEKEAFQQSMVGFQEEMRKIIGYQVTELCSPYNRERLKKKLDSEIRNFSYSRIKNDRFNEMALLDPGITDINEKNFQLMRREYIEKGRYRLLLGTANFAESFFASEWLIQKYFPLEELDNTFIVTGYLKSVEQLLWDIIIIVGNGRPIKGIPIAEENVELIDRTLGELEDFITSYENDDLFQDAFECGGTHFVMRYLKRQLKDWRKRYRNGYFHKDNLKDKKKIDAIREETWFLYYLILGSIQFTPSQLRQLEN